MATIIGAGVIGLTTGVILQESGTDVRLITKEDPSTTTSSAAGAIWYPYNAPDDPSAQGWMKSTLDELSALADVGGVPVARCETRQWLVDQAPDPYWAWMTDSFRHATADELPSDRTDGWIFSSVIIDAPRYLQWLTERFNGAGGVIVHDTVDSLDSLSGAFFNCTGIGAKETTPDNSVFPIRGQVIRIVNPGLTTAIIDDDNPAGLTYILPRTDDCILGGSSDPNDWNRYKDDELTELILQRCQALEPGIGDPEILDVRVGLRPGRPVIRVEREDRPNATIIHNYGHAGNGYSTSWGTARHAIDLLKN